MRPCYLANYPVYIWLTISISIHSGLYLAQAKNLYADAGLHVELIAPDESYSTTPARQLASGSVDLAICPSESCIAYNESGRMPLQAIYALLQRDASAIVSTRESNLAKLGEGVYGSYSAKYEDGIVRAMVSAAGGKGEAMRVKGSNEVGKLSLFEAARKGEVDATWVFMPWEGVEAELDGVPVYVFRAEDYGVPYGYSPVIARNADKSLDAEVLRRFVRATKLGYEAAVRDAREAAALLQSHCRPQRSDRFLAASQERINGFYGDGSKAGLGSMEPGKWETWIAWLREQGLLAREGVRTEQLFTNEFLEV